jgi:hypothetical protein
VGDLGSHSFVTNRCHGWGKLWRASQAARVGPMQIWSTWNWNDWNGPHLCGKMYLEMILPGLWELHEKSFVCALHGLQEPMTNCWLRSCTLQANSSSTDHTLGQEVRTSVVLCRFSNSAGSVRLWKMKQTPCMSLLRRLCDLNYCGMQ